VIQSGKLVKLESRFNVRSVEKLPYSLRSINCGLTSVRQLSTEIPEPDWRYCVSVMTARQDFCKNTAGHKIDYSFLNR
jgi:hypothetical protein